MSLGIALALTACASTGGGSGQAPAGDAEEVEDRARLEAIYRARQDSALLEVSPADVEFMTGMIAHHAQALVMSGMAPENGASPVIRTLAARITNAQRDEIRNMQRWLRDRGRPVPEVEESGAMPGLVMPEGTGDHRMPGMLSRGQMDELRRARGREFDRLFLEYMIQHHQGAVTMVQELFATDGAAQDEFVFKLASDIQVDQITEINRMRQMLEGMSASGGDGRSLSQLQ